MSAHVLFLSLLERLRRLDASMPASSFGSARLAFLRRRWITESGYLTHVMVDVLDSELEVAVDVDAPAGVYRYRSMQSPGQTVTRPLVDITMYRLQLDVWMEDLADLIGEDRCRAVQLVRVRDHLWHLGDVRVAGLQDLAPVFLVRDHARAQDKVAAVLADAVWPRPGIVLADRAMPDVTLPCGHALRQLRTFVRSEAGAEIFDAAAIDRVLRAGATPGHKAERVQFLDGSRLKLPHWPASRTLTQVQARIVRQMWGQDGQPAPEMSWKDVSHQASTSYQSFDDAFATKAEREDVIEWIRRGRYRLRRKP